MKISVVICTFQAETLIGPCLRSIQSQDHADWEALCLDGGSTDRTREIVAEFAARDPRIRGADNPAGLPEGRNGGKSVGLDLTDGDVVCFLDQDNVLQGPGVFSRALRALDGADPAVPGVLGGLAHDRRDPAVVRFVSLFGTDAFLAYRSVDFLRQLRRPARGADWETFDLRLDNLPLTGGNCFFYLRRTLRAVGGYTQDVRVVRDLVRAGKTRLRILPGATKHYAAPSLGSLAHKKFRWGRAYFRSDGDRFRYWPGTAREAVAFAANFAACLLGVPNLAVAAWVFARCGDPVAFAFPGMAFLNLVAYAAGALAPRRRGTAPPR